MGDVSRNARGVDDVEQRQVVDLPSQLHQEGHRLPDSTSSADDGHLQSLAIINLSFICQRTDEQFDPITAEQRNTSKARGAESVGGRAAERKIRRSMPSVSDKCNHAVVVARKNN